MYLLAKVLLILHNDYQYDVCVKKSRSNIPTPLTFWCLVFIIDTNFAEDKGSGLPV